MKEFDLDAAKKGAPVYTRDGRKARIVCFDVRNNDFPIIAVINHGEYEDYEGYTSDGRYYEDKGKTSCYDLMMAEDVEACNNSDKACEFFEKSITRLTNNTLTINNMENIFENVKFGDKFVTRDGRIAIYHSYNNIYPDNPYESHHNLILKEKDKESDALWVFVNDYGHADEHINGIWLYETCRDIVGRWQEPIDEDCLEILA